MHYVIFLSGSFLSQVVSTEKKATIYHHTKMFSHPCGKTATHLSVQVRSSLQWTMKWKQKPLSKGWGLNSPASFLCVSWKLSNVSCRNGDAINSELMGHNRKMAHFEYFQDFQSTLHKKYVICFSESKERIESTYKHNFDEPFLQLLSIFKHGLKACSPHPNLILLFLPLQNLLRPPVTAGYPLPIYLSTVSLNNI